MSRDFSGTSAPWIAALKRMAAMADHMPAFHQLLSTAQPADMEQLTRKFPGLYRYAKILESLASGIQSGAIPVPGRKEVPQQTEQATGYRQLAGAMDLRVRQLAEEGIPRSAIIERMTGYVVDLGKIWNSTTDEQLAALCREYPGFHTYAELMEEAAEAERQKLARPYDGLSALPDALKEQLSSLLGAAAKLERDYQSVLDAAGTAAPTAWRLPPGRLHAQWQADLTRVITGADELPHPGVDLPGDPKLCWLVRAMLCISRSAPAASRQSAVRWPPR
jgi:hypothetical protein